MKQLHSILVSFTLLLIIAPVGFAQSAPESPSQLKEYLNPPAIKPVDTVFMEEMTWLEMRDALKSGKSTVIVPAGGLEATGPFITLDKHQNMLRGATDRIARKLGNALVAPVIRYVPPDDGARGPYLGDFNISLAAYKSILTDICATLKTDGFKEIILIGDHQGAQRGMKEVAEELAPKWANGPSPSTLCRRLLRSQSGQRIREDHSRNYPKARWRRWLRRQLLQYRHFAGRQSRERPFEGTDRSQPIDGQWD